MCWGGFNGWDVYNEDRWSPDDVEPPCQRPSSSFVSLPRRLIDFVCDRSKGSASQETKPVGLTKPVDMRQVWHKGRSPLTSSLFKKRIPAHPSNSRTRQRAKTHNKSGAASTVDLRRCSVFNQDKWDVGSRIQKASFFFCTNSTSVTHFLLFSDLTQRQKASQSQSRN